MQRTAQVVAAPAGTRLRGVDVSRGLAVVGMLVVDDRGSDAIGVQLVHAPWHGLHVADVVFPVFLLVVGVSMPLSRRTQHPRAVLLRVLRLAVLGYLVVTAKYGIGAGGAGVLGHIAAAYLLCWLLLRLPPRGQGPVAVTVLALVGVVTALLPVPGAGRPAMEPDLSWAAWLDGSLGGPLSAEAPHAWLPSAVTVFLGVLAGRVLQRHDRPQAVRRLLAGAAPLLAAGLLLAPVVPLNKRLWTPSYVLVTGAIGLAVLAAATWLADVRGGRRATRPLEVLGANAIVVFAASELVFRAVLGRAVQPAVVGALTGLTGAAVAAWAYALAGVGALWALAAALARRDVVVRI